ncbi:hypothetical protein GOV03_03530 [Candidatus Woesearchaeota archaeon]|nr:hypothetical protein [Candidatus Woesearchaeota archaeon]
MNLQELIASNRESRSKIFKPIGKFLLKLKLTANIVTSLSFILGIIAVYFLFQNHLLFIIFAIIHLIADALDGVLARLTKPTLFGKYFDYLTDRLISLLVLIKIYLYLQDYFILLILALFVINQIIHLISRLESPLIYFRTGSLIYLSFWPLFPFIPFLTIGYLIAGITSIYSFLTQVKYFIKSK